MIPFYVVSTFDLKNIYIFLKKKIVVITRATVQKNSPGLIGSAMIWGKLLLGFFNPVIYLIFFLNC